MCTHECLSPRLKHLMALEKDHPEICLDSQNLSESQERIQYPFPFLWDPMVRSGQELVQNDLTTRLQQYNKP